MSHSNAAPHVVVGFVGLGDQGLPMAQAIAAAGFPTHSWARRPEVLDDPRLAAVVRHSSAEDLAAHVDVLAVCISTDEATVELADRIFPVMRAGAIFANHGTGTPANAVALAELGARHGIRVIDAPVSGGRPAAEARALTTMLGGEESAIDATTPVFDTFSARVIRLGPSGAGQRAKLFNNALLLLNLQSLADILALAAEGGADIPALTDALASGSAASRALSLLGTMIRPDTAEHLSEVLLLDMEIFAAALRADGTNPALVDRIVAAGTAGAQRLADTVGLLG